MPILKRPFVFEDRMGRLPHITTSPNTSIFDAQSPRKIVQIGQILASGDMLLGRDILTIISTQQITAYAVDDPRNPVQKWCMQLHDGTSVTSARMYSQLYHPPRSCAV